MLKLKWISFFGFLILQGINFVFLNAAHAAVGANGVYYPSGGETLVSQSLKLPTEIRAEGDPG